MAFPIVCCRKNVRVVDGRLIRAHNPLLPFSHVTEDEGTLRQGYARVTLALGHRRCQPSPTALAWPPDPFNFGHFYYLGRPCPRPCRGPAHLSLSGARIHATVSTARPFLRRRVNESGGIGRGRVEAKALLHDHEVAKEILATQHTLYLWQPQDFHLCSRAGGTLVFSRTPNWARTAKMRRCAALGRGWTRHACSPVCDNWHVQFESQHNLT